MSTRYEKLKRSIAEFGYVEPVIWNRQTGNVVGGHQRLKVLVDLGQREIDCVVVDLDLQREKALNIALNKIQGDWDESKLASLMAEFDASAFDVSLTGFDAEEVDALLNKCQFFLKRPLSGRALFVCPEGGGVPDLCIFCRLHRLFEQRPRRGHAYVLHRDRNSERRVGAYAGA